MKQSTLAAIVQGSAVFAVACVGAALVTVGASNIQVATNSQVLDHYERAKAICDGTTDVGTDPTNGEINAALAELECQSDTDPDCSDVKHVVTWEDTGVPANLCTANGQAGNRAQLVCSLKNMNNDRLILTANHLTFRCSSPDGSTAPLWIRVTCP